MLLHPLHREVRAEAGPEQEGSGPTPGVHSRKVGTPDFAFGAQDSGSDIQFVQLHEGDNCTGMLPHSFSSSFGVVEK